ncbi:MAG: D-tagatose-bisphosphate aldolase, class II, non-catalytic subunit [Alphaproteobacteria bacterium]|nr:D-tagatose-bisphosphate aldolase, class II, non-catalytic subunit [Alphaproteobacteria bacterium]MBU1280759.1 D-tagatose-bisphosphate aldolase, class II, non-catalytic subunit [Alphaproteobacteria bacterium]MBU1575183.1 D-tagatose-bisphosphate aldolase, class II, non-catalytic subunit [Alphaproteobacteria bacterium]MBU1829280.1 D-tagatose-bisphosphate aldolase, class II, non-catalytic subunit [Alphaproteobacteria bacterium]MBU2076759.1 D-tagatose-bisphosphate aldolase, class II, non-catalyti
MTAIKLTDLARLHRSGQARGITSVCSAHPIVLRAALRHGREHNSTVLIEATCNQVNHNGGYTGMTPADFADLVFDLAREEGCPRDLILLGGDHLGPNPWRHLPADEAMEQACEMIEAYVSAGFRKLHLDASMGCANEPGALDDETTARRAASLAKRAEETAAKSDLPLPLYIIGTEVPPPGGADHALDEITPTAHDAARATIAVHHKIFTEHGLSEMLGRVIGLVVQPGVEFGNHNVIPYDTAKARDLIRVLEPHEGLVFEAHSTDYQGTGPLSELVRDGFSILKVGPELTFVLREALYALDLIASDMLPDYGDRPLYHAMEELMQAKPENWARHYHGTDTELRVMRHYSLSDRIRYYWTEQKARSAVADLLAALRDQTVPPPLMWQHLPRAAEAAGRPLDPEALLIRRVSDTLSEYHAACALEEA